MRKASNPTATLDAQRASVRQILESATDYAWRRPNADGIHLRLSNNVYLHVRNSEVKIKWPDGVDPAAIVGRSLKTRTDRGTVILAVWPDGDFGLDEAPLATKSDVSTTAAYVLARYFAGEAPARVEERPKVEMVEPPLEIKLEPEPEPETESEEAAPESIDDDTIEVDEAEPESIEAVVVENPVDDEISDDESDDLLDDLLDVVDNLPDDELAELHDEVEPDDVAIVALGGPKELGEPAAPLAALPSHSPVPVSAPAPVPIPPSTRVEVAQLHILAVALREIETGGPGGAITWGPTGMRDRARAALEDAGLLSAGAKRRHERELLLVRREA